MKYTLQLLSMIKENPNLSNQIAYFIDFSIQEIPHIIYIAYEIGGTIYTDSVNTFNIIKNEYNNIKVKYFKSIDNIKNDIIDHAIKIIIYPDYHIRFFKDIPDLKHVQVFHGISDKSYDYSKQVMDYDLFFIAGKDSYERYRKKGLLKKNTGRLIGYPKFDRVFKGEIKKDEIAKILNIDSNIPTVLYAPTWIDKALNSSWKKFYKKIILDKPDRLNLIIKPHPNIVRYRKKEIEECYSLAKGNSKIKILDKTHDITPILAVSDLLLGDVSSVTREFLAFKRPFVFLSNKPKWLWKKDKIKLWDCGDVVLRPDKLWKIVEDSLNNPKKYIENLEYHLKNTFYKPDGNAAKRAAEEILKLL